MENENKDANLQNGENAETEVKTDVVGDGAEESNEEETSSEKPTETLEARQARLQRQLKQVNKKLGIEEEKPKAKKAEKKSDELDYAQKAYLKASGIDSNEFDFVQEVMQETGKSLEDVLESRYFKADLAERREAQKVNNAVPQRDVNGRSTELASNKAEYWLKKGELPPNTPEYQQLRRDVVNARYEREKSGFKFSDKPIIEQGGV